jgi:2'-5' RNA ligase
MPVLATSLDEPSASLVRGLWDRIERELGLKGVRKVPFPHFTWLGCELLDTPRLVDLLGTLGPEQVPVHARSASLGVFLQPAPVIHLAVVRSPGVEALHRRLWNLVESCAAEMHGLYRPELWVPHITLAQGDLRAEQVPEVMRLLGDIAFPLDFTCKNLTLFHWIGPRFEPIERFPLIGR